MASASSIGWLDSIQRAALRITAGLPSTTPIIPIFAEIGQPPIKTEIITTTRLQPTSIIRLVYDILQNDLMVFLPITLALKEAAIPNSFHIPLILPLLTDPNFRAYFLNLKYWSLDNMLRKMTRLRHRPPRIPKSGDFLIHKPEFNAHSSQHSTANTEWAR